MDNLNAQINDVQNLIKNFNLTHSNDPVIKRITRDFYEIVQGISRDINSANKAVTEINILRKKMSGNINRDSSKINDILRELFNYTKNKASYKLKETRDVINDDL